MGSQSYWPGTEPALALSPDDPDLLIGPFWLNSTQQTENQWFVISLTY